MNAAIYFAITAFIAVVLLLLAIITLVLRFGKGLDFFPFSIFLLTLAVGIAFADSLFPANSENPIIQFILQFKTLLILILAFVLVFFSIQNFLSARSKNSRSCDSVPVAMYEPFASETSKTTRILQLIRRANAILEGLQTGTDELIQMSSDACSLLKETQQTFIDANAEIGQQSEQYNECVSSKGNEEECKNLKNSPERQQKLDDRRRASAEKLYENEKQRFMGSQKSVLECFEDAEDTSELENELHDILFEIQPFVEPAEEAKTLRMCKQIRDSMSFVLYLVKKGNTKMNNANSGVDDKLKDAKIEPFDNSSTSESNKKLDADTILAKASRLVTEISNTKSEYVKAKSEYDTLQGKINRMASGEPSPSDILKAPKATQGSCPTYMFEYAKDAGGYCCADAPSEYNSERGEYLNCPSSSEISEEIKKARRSRINEAMKKCGENDTSCISKINSMFTMNLKTQLKCRLPDNPRTEVPICSYICPKSGKECSYAEFQTEPK